MEYVNLEYGKYLVTRIPTISENWGFMCSWGEWIFCPTRIDKYWETDTDANRFKVYLTPMIDGFVRRAWYTMDIKMFDPEQTTKKVFDNLEDATKFAYDMNVKYGYIKPKSKSLMSKIKALFYGK